MALTKQCHAMGSAQAPATDRLSLSNPQDEACPRDARASAKRAAKSREGADELEEVSGAVPGCVVPEGSVASASVLVGAGVVVLDLLDLAFGTGGTAVPTLPSAGGPHGDMILKGTPSSGYWTRA